MALLNHALKHATDGFIGILDMFGFEDSKPSQLEQLCINLCSETMQHFYNTHIFKSSIESCREEGITYDVTIDYVDNVPCIDLISSLVSWNDTKFCENNFFTVWKLHDFSITQILCEIKFGDSGSAKSAIFLPF